ncbi:hypothetical protein [Bradyrhizobium lablabi]|uniref:hypothetical protein n=1 Tax=Bradyrhizobium lablabi TaxID=722472 RepID=UPI001BAA8555|nr:hypothetical protein [Bradyrhizobium lablabi]MBR0696680.1 hypothetical protein [Bradyrhizobium lablabi]
MLQLHSSTSERDQVVDTIITLTHLSNLNRAIVAGLDSTELYVDLRRRGFVRIGLPSTFRLRKAVCAVGLITVRDSFAEFESALAQVAPSLGTSAMIAVLIRSDPSGFALNIRKKLEQLGFRIEAGVRCHRGLVLSAGRQAFGHMECAA